MTRFDDRTAGWPKPAPPAVEGPAPKLDATGLIAALVRAHEACSHRPVIIRTSRAQPAPLRNNKETPRTMKIYRIALPGAEPAFIRAKTKTAAVACAVAGVIDSRVATQDDLLGVDPASVKTAPSKDRPGRPGNE